MSGTDAAAIARLEEQVRQLIRSSERYEERMEDMAKQLDAVQAKLDQSAGGFAVLKWFGFGSLASVISVGAAVYAWMHKTQ